MDEKLVVHKRRSGQDSLCGEKGFVIYLKSMVTCRKCLEIMNGQAQKPIS